jgi:hypothetical protein
MVAIFASTKETALANSLRQAAKLVGRILLGTSISRIRGLF